LDRVQPPDLIIWDEAHHCVCPSWLKIVAACRDTRIIGFTATPARLDGRGLGEAGFAEIIEGPTAAELMDMGHLARCSIYAPEKVANLDKIRIIRGDYDNAALAEQMDKAKVTGDAIGHYKRHLNGKRCIVACVSVKHAEHVAEAYRAAGIPAASV